MTTVHPRVRKPTLVVGLLASLAMAVSSAFSAGIPYPIPPGSSYGGLGDAGGYPAIFDQGNAVAVSA